MASTREDTNAFETLCEACGYSLEAIDPSGVCPECARPVAQSLPDYRPGSPWQVAPSLVSWLVTNALTLRKPVANFSRLRMSMRGAKLLLLFNTLCAAALLVAPWVGTVPIAYRRVGLGAAILAPALASTIWILTWIEHVGIRFFAKRRGWRLTRVAAWQICAHASVGWMLAGLFPMLILALGYSVQRLLGVVPRWTIDLSPVASTPIQINIATAGIAGEVIGFLAGLLIFESLVYVGVRRCRYAAAVRA